MEMSDIALLMGSTETAVRKALSRARQAVRKEYYKKYQS
jgi:DNA-directed RNA polymerase specialized sigma24 family protein